MAAALEHHAANLEQTIRKFHGIREDSSGASALRSYIRRYPTRHGMQGD